MRESFGSALVRLRKRAGHTQTSLAAATGVSRSAIYKWERGERPPQRATCSAIAQALGVDVVALWRPAVWSRLSDSEREIIESELAELRAARAPALLRLLDAASEEQREALARAVVVLGEMPPGQAARWLAHFAQTVTLAEESTRRG